jgi:hypothetical protein
MVRITRKRVALLCAGFGTAAALGVFTFGATNALFTSQADSQTNHIVAGTVTLAEDQSKSHVMDVSGFMPGDGSCYSPPSGAKYTCDKPRNEYFLDYTGSNPAFVGLDFTVASSAAKPCPTYNGGQSSISPDDVVANCTGLGQLPLFDGKAGSGDLDLSITPENGDTAHQLVLDSDLVGKTTCSADASGVVSCTSEIDNILLPVGYGGSPNSGLQWVTNSTDFIQVDTGLPTTAGNEFQGSDVTFTLTGHAVQWDNNNSTKGAGTCDAGTTFPNGLTATSVPCPVSWGA